MGLETVVISDEQALEPILEEWDALAVAAGRPFCAPGWMLPWWRHARPTGARLRVFAASERGSLVGIAPLWERGGRYGFLTGRLSPPVGPLAAPGREVEAIEALAAALAEASPRLAFLRLEEGIGSTGAPQRLVDAWPGARCPWLHLTPPTPLPAIALDGRSLDEWLATKSSKFRQEMRRMRRRLDDAGASFELAGPDDAERAIGAFIELHAARRQERGPSNALVPGLRPMLVEAARELAPSGRLRLYTIEVDGRPVAANVLLAAGEDVSGWNSGFDAAWARYSPSLQLTLHALDDAGRRGQTRMSLGPGGGGYKARMADMEDEVATATIVPRGRGYARARLGLIPYQARWALSARLSSETKGRVRRLLGR